MVTVNVILGSNRQVAIGKRLFKYLENQIAPLVGERDEITFKFITLDQYHLDFFHEDLPPIDNPERKLAPNEQQWIDDMQAADGYIFITPEYNHSIPAVLKNAIDYLAFEGNRKPAKIISYADSMRAGQFGGEALREVINRLGFITLPMIITVGKVTANFSADGFLLEDAPSGAYYQKKLLETLHEIGFYSRILKGHPYQEFNSKV